MRLYLHVSLVILQLNNIVIDYKRRYLLLHIHMQSPFTLYRHIMPTIINKLYFYKSDIIAGKILRINYNVSVLFLGFRTKKEQKV